MLRLVQRCVVALILCLRHCQASPALVLAHVHVLPASGKRPSQCVPVMYPCALEAQKGEQGSSSSSGTAAVGLRQMGPVTPHNRLCKVDVCQRQVPPCPNVSSSSSLAVRRVIVHTVRYPEHHANTSWNNRRLQSGSPPSTALRGPDGHSSVDGRGKPVSGDPPYFSVHGPSSG